MKPPADAADRPLSERTLDDLLAESVRFHGDLCPGQVLGVRMTVAGCRELGIDRPRDAGKRLVVIVEIDRCAVDAIQALTGTSLGRRTLRFLDYGKTAATFVDRASDTAVRVAAREDARRAVPAGERDPRQAQIAAYRTMPETHLLRIDRVEVSRAWLDPPRVRVACDVCGEGVHYEREILVGGRALCRACTGDRYYSPPADA